jgi:hypothetical protein
MRHASWAGISLALCCIIALLFAWRGTVPPPAGRGRVVVIYRACGGLINQHYSHMAAFSLALALRAEVTAPRGGPPALL